MSEPITPYTPEEARAWAGFFDDDAGYCLARESRPSPEASDCYDDHHLAATLIAYATQSERISELEVALREIAATTRVELEFARRIARRALEGGE